MQERTRSTANETLCFLCCAIGADSTEHVLSRCLWPDRRLPNDVPTLPAHTRCNRHTSKDEEAFRNFLAASIPPTSPAYPVWERTWRAIHDPKARGMLKGYYNDIRPVGHTEDGLADDRLVTTMQIDRVHRVLAKMIRGLFHRETGDLLPADAWWTFDQRDAMRVRGVSRGFQFWFEVNDVVSAGWMRAGDSFTTLWEVWFYGTTGWMVTTRSDRSIDIGRTSSPVQVIWPGA